MDLVLLHSQALTHGCPVLLWERLSPHIDIPCSVALVMAKEGRLLVKCLWSSLCQNFWGFILQWCAWISLWEAELLSLSCLVFCVGQLGLSGCVALLFQQQISRSVYPLPFAHMGKTLSESLGMWFTQTFLFVDGCLILYWIEGQMDNCLMPPDADTVFWMLLILITNSHKFSGKGYTSFRILNIEPLMEVQMSG